VCEPVAGVTGDYEDVLFATGIAADEGQAVHAIEDLAGPAELDCADVGEVFPGPVREPSVLVVVRAFLSRFVVLAADDQEIFRVATVVNLLATHIVERLGRVPVKKWQRRISLDCHADYVGAVCGLLCVHLHPVVHGRLVATMTEPAETWKPRLVPTCAVLPVVISVTSVCE
jgi:hypothetical protein